MAKVLIGNFKGPKGDKGDKGDPGTAASIQVGTTQTVQPEENAEIINTGTASAAVLNFKIPRGKDGMTDLTAEYKDDSSYTCQPTVNAPVVVKELDGKTEQVETTGAQLFDADQYYAQYKQDDGTYAISANEIANIFIPITANMVGKQYTFSASGIPAANDTFYTQYYKSSDEIYNGNVIGGSTSTFSQSKITFTPEETGGYIRFSHSNLNDGIVQIKDIMLNLGAAVLPWEPYTGGSPAPSPDYQQAIKGVGGMGYFDGEWVQGNISSTGTIGTETTGITSVNAIPCKQNDNIAVTYADSIDVIAVAFYNASGAYISTSTSGNSVDTFTATVPANAASFKVNLRVVSGSTITPNGAKYCTVTINGEYQTGVEVMGKNLAEVTLAPGTYTEQGVTINLRIDGSYTLNGTPTKDGVFRLNQPQGGDFGSYPIIRILKQGKKYRLSCCQLFLRNASNPNGTTSGVNAMNNDIIYTPTEDTEIIGIRARYENGKTYNSSKVYYPGIWEDESETDTDYQPYHHTALSIPLTSPLYEGDKICYVKPGDKYVNADGDTVTADRVLYGCYRENAVVVFDGSEDESWIGDGGVGNNRYRINIPDIKPNLHTNPIGVCNLFVYNRGVYIDAYDVEGYCVGSNIMFFIRFTSTSDVNSNSALRSFLQENNLRLVYPLSQPYFEPLTDQSIMYDLRSYEPLTYITAESNITVDVAKNSTGGYLLESYAQAQKNAISEANSQSRISAIEQQLVNQATTPTE